MAFLTLGLFEELCRRAEAPHATGREIEGDRGRWHSARRGALHDSGGAPLRVNAERGGAGSGVGSVVGAGGSSGLEVWTLSLSADDDSGWQPRFVHAAAAGRRFVNLSEIIDLAGTSAAADRIASLGLDVLIDLNGYTTDERAELLAMGLAPVVMHAVGYPGSMGASFVPYMLLDRYAAPPLATARAREALSERLVLQPHCYQVNDHGRHPLPPSHAQQLQPQQPPQPPQPPQPQQQQPPPQQPPSSQRPILINFNQAYKLSRVAGELWCAALLRSGPDSRLWLLRQPDDAEPFLRAELAACGVHERRRVIFAPIVADIPGHLARVATASLGVDTPEYNTHTTGSDALWGGVPMVSAPGEPMAARVASSLLKATAMSSGVVGGLKEYVDAVAALVAAS
jgi:protein O-GlcNAc transferase